MSRIVPVTAGLISCVLLSGCGGGSSGSGEVEPDLSGGIDIESGTRVDSDTADDRRVDLAMNNDTVASAQTLPPTATVGGYLSADDGVYDTLPPNLFRYYMDAVDVYAVDLSPGDRIAFQVFSAPELFFPSTALPPERSLRILKQQGGSFVAVASQTASEDLRPLVEVLDDTFEPGFYLIEVSASGGIPFRYVLSLAGETSASVMNTSYTAPPFMIDEAVVSLEATAGNQPMAASIAALDQRDLGRGTWLMRRHATRSVAAMSANQMQDARQDTLDWVRELRQQPGVESAEPNYLYASQQVSPDNDPLYSRQWNLPLIQTPLAWQVAPEVGEGIGIAVMDTGVFRSPPTTSGNWHPDLVANIQVISGEVMDFVAGDLDIDKEDTGLRDDNPADPGDGKAQSSNFHGTHVAGIAAAADNSLGIVGLAPNATIYPVRVLGRDGVGSSADLIDALNWAAARDEIDVINLSLGGLGPSTALKQAIDAVWNNGKLIVAAAGNQGTDEPTYPAAYSNVIGVGAVDGGSARASYSNIGQSVDVVAPGGDASRDANQDGTADLIISTWGRDDTGTFEPGYAGLQGTSMAAPHVAGVYALMKAQVPALTPASFRSFLINGDLTDEVGPAFEYGAGLINALAAMDAVLDGNFPITLGSSPTALQFNSAVLSEELVFSIYPEGESVTITDVDPGAPWLEVGEFSSDPSLPLTVTANTSGLEDNRRYTTELVISYRPEGGAVATLTVPVSLRLGSSPDERDAGRHYVLLVSADDERETLEQVVASATQGRYRFAFDELEPGEYFLVAGTDMDNNGLICENGEACAEYPVNGLPEKIVIGEEPLGGVRLSTSFRRPTITSLGLPRVGFEGYRLKPESKSERKQEMGGDPVRNLENNR
ncbi:S8 family serine peptidase [Marinobacter sp. 71-i]|uniref:S8 family serine peptidase n=1 Tax=Marinobacter iranensis TaxID=2962607 RepID=A0ABT5Y5I2_9GAMM|nr:S8 family serine peptidase [Marinobacter iranensis]MDF0748819.1 S8 family serine peptidase [Marinobacter iranensis]